MWHVSCMDPSSNLLEDEDTNCFYWALPHCYYIALRWDIQLTLVNKMAFPRANVALKRNTVLIGGGTTPPTTHQRLPWAASCWWKLSLPWEFLANKRFLGVYLCGWVLAVSEVGYRIKEQEGIILHIIFTENQNLNEADKFMGHVL